eukprot:gene16109-17731_t
MVDKITFSDTHENALHVKNLRDIVSSCIGPRGRIKVFRTLQGGFALLTTVSSRLFNSLSLQKPILQTLMAGLKSHANVFCDGSLILADFACSIYIEHLESEVPRHVSMKINDCICENLIELLAKENVMSIKLDIGKLNNMIVPVKSILTSKPICQLSMEEASHLSVLILKAFYGSLSGNVNEASINIVSCEGAPVMESKLANGILLPLSNIDAHTGWLLQPENGSIKAVLCTMSLAGHQSVFSEKTELNELGKASLNNAVSVELMAFCEAIIKAEVKLLLCQKVVHPFVKRYLNKHDVFVLERLGLQPISLLCLKLRLHAIQSLFTEVDQTHVGEIGRAETVEFHSRSDESTLDELKATVLAAEKTLFHLIKDRRIVHGAGCFETQVAAHLRSLHHEDLNAHPGLEHATKAQIETAVTSIARSFEHVAKAIQRDAGDFYVDTCCNHFWCFPRNTLPEAVVNENMTCCCGYVTYRPSIRFRSLMQRIRNEAGLESEAADRYCPRDLPDVADSLVTKREAISAAFELCNVILRIGASLEG